MPHASCQIGQAFNAEHHHPETPLTRLRYSAGVAAAIVVFAQTVPAVPAGAAELGADESGAVLKQTLERLRAQDLWGEAVLSKGGVRQIKVVSVQGDTVQVREVVGPFQEMPATYSLGDFHTLRELGHYRISQRRSAYRPPRSLATALLLELVIPGGGNYYAGETKQAFTLVLFSAGAVVTAVTTGEDGAAGWVPVLVWTKVASMFHLADEIQAINTTHELSERGRLGASVDHGGSRLTGRSGGVAVPIVGLRYSF